MRYSGHSSARTDNRTVQCNQVVANEKHAYGDCAHGPLVFVPHKCVSELLGDIQLAIRPLAAENRMTNIIDYIIPMQYLRKWSSSAYIQNMRSNHLMMKNAALWSPVESLNQGRENSKELGKSHQNSNMLHAIQASFVIQVMQAPDLLRQQPYISHSLPRPQL